MQAISIKAASGNVGLPQIGKSPGNVSVSLVSTHHTPLVQTRWTVLVPSRRPRGGAILEVVNKNNVVRDDERNSQLSPL